MGCTGSAELEQHQQLQRSASGERRLAVAAGGAARVAVGQSRRDMPIAYHPEHFARVLFARTGSALPRSLPRALCLLPLALLAQLLWEFEVLLEDREHLLTAFSMLVGLMATFRLNDAYHKWNIASHLVLKLHARTRSIMSLLFCYCGDGTPTEELEPRLERIRRLLVLAAVMIKKHVRGESDFGEELRTGLITEDEARVLKKDVVTMSNRDAKKDIFPWRNRPAFYSTRCTRRPSSCSGTVSCPASPRPASRRASRTTSTR